MTKWQAAVFRESSLATLTVGRILIVAVKASDSIEGGTSFTRSSYTRGPLHSSRHWMTRLDFVLSNLHTLT